MNLLGWSLFGSQGIQDVRHHQIAVRRHPEVSVFLHRKAPDDEVRHPVMRQDLDRAQQCLFEPRRSRGLPQEICSLCPHHGKVTDFLLFANCEYLTC